ncbi:MAG: DUF1501 domain-containing protein [Planctomycetota bacterium]
MISSNDSAPGLCSEDAHLHRRTLLGAGVGGVAARGLIGSAMMSQIARRLVAEEAAGKTDPAKPKNIIMLWLEGGPSQLETFDPHPGKRIGGSTQAIPTSLRGVQLADTLPQTAEQMHLASLVRSVTSKEGDHARAIYNVKTGWRLDPTLRHPALGSIISKQEMDVVAEREIPPYISILPGLHAGKGGYLGATYDAFRMGDPKDPVPDVRSPVGDERLQRRLDDLYNIVEPQFRSRRLQSLDSDRTLHLETTRSARRMMNSKRLSAFDVSDEPKSELAAFGDTPFGRGVLAASRLVDAGARCVEVTLGGWDSHVTNDTLQRSACESLDPALASLLRRLKERDMLDNTLVVCGGEFGRTPQINAAEGRDHWPHGFSVLMAGGGIAAGRVIGETAADPKLDPAKPLSDVSDPVRIEDLHATILRVLGVDYAEELMTPIGRPLRISEGEVIDKLLA